MTEYGYNEVNELVLVRYPGRTEELFYDKAGNRTGRVADGVETRYEYDACNRLIRMTGRGQKAGSAGPSEFTAYTKDAVTVEFEYDNQGNLLRDDKAEYAVDVRNRVVKAELFDGNIQINRYDAEGLRAEVEENGRLTGFVFDGTEAVMEETEGETVRYIRGYRNRIIASDCESARQYYHYACDELGSVTHVVVACEDGESVQKPDQRIRNTYEYDAFGNQVKCEENVPNRFCFAGEQYDAVTQQYYLRARFYNPVIGRFTQEDSYHGDGLNLYAYCHNNPMYYVDPSGHDVRAAAEKNYVNKALDAMNGYADKGIDAMMKEVYGSGDGTGPDGGSKPTVIDYSNQFNKELLNFNDGYKIKDSIEKDMILVQYSSDSPNASLKYWTTADEANSILAVEVYMDKLALSKDWGTRNTVKVARIKEGTKVKFAIGTAKAQTQIPDPRPGGGIQLLFSEFDTNWIIEIRSFPDD